MKTSPVRYHFKSSFDFCMRRGFRVRSFTSELNKSFHDRTSLRRCDYHRDLQKYCKGCRCCGIFKMLQLLQCFSNVAVFKKMWKRCKDFQNTSWEVEYGMAVKWSVKTQGNKLLKTVLVELDVQFIEHNNINEYHLNKCGRHLSARGDAALARNLIQFIKNLEVWHADPTVYLI